MVIGARPDLFLPAEDIAARMRDLVATVKGSPRAVGVDEIFMPGETEKARETRRPAAGIDDCAPDLEPLGAAARQRGVPLPAPLTGAFSS